MNWKGKYAQEFYKEYFMGFNDCMGFKAVLAVSTVLAVFDVLAVLAVLAELLSWLSGCIQFQLWYLGELLDINPRFMKISY